MQISSLSVLAVEVTSKEASVSWKNKNLQGNLTFDNCRYIETKLAHYVKRSLIELQHAPNIILVGVGPGSYSSCRVAIASTISLGLWYKCPVVGLPSTLATLASRENTSILIGNARRGQYFSWNMSNGNFNQTPQFHTQKALAALVKNYQNPIYTFDDSNDFLFEKTCVISKIKPQASQLIDYWQTLNLTQQEHLIDLYNHNSLEPIYLRSAQITPAKK